MKNYLLAFSLLLLLPFPGRTEDGYRLWLRYDLIDDVALRQSYLNSLQTYQVSGNAPTTDLIRQELQLGLQGLLGTAIPESKNFDRDGFLLIGTPETSPEIQQLRWTDIAALHPEGYLLKTVTLKGKTGTVITARSEIGLLYGTFQLLRLLQSQQQIQSLNLAQNPQIDLRILNHWDNLDRTVERGYAGFSIWDWHRLPDYIDQRYHDYARANASIGINGTVLTNVNANALILRPDYLEKVKALADVFRPYGLKVYLTARFSAPIQAGGLKTADPLDPAVQQWWNDKATEIYQLIPDFGGFLVKANSEGQPGPQNYDRSHAEGANMLADAVAPHGGIVMWRAFVYSAEEPDDRAKQANQEFVPLDGTFRDNVLIQVKNGAIDFQPREPFHPLFGAMPKTPLMMEFQITQEYLGQATHLVFLAPMYKEVLDADTYARGPGSTVAKVVKGELDSHRLSGIAGVSNIGNDRNWTGHLFGQANWYAYGRLAWDPDLTSEAIAEEWVRQTFSNEPEVVKPLTSLLLNSHEACVNYMTPLGLHHIMGPGHHYGPGPWVSKMSRADWTSVYYHKADSLGLGFDRTPTGSDATSQYAPPAAKTFASRELCPEKYLLWFHHVGWNEKLASGQTLWQALCEHYWLGTTTVQEMHQTWHSLADKIDRGRYQQVDMLLTIQEKEARWWRDACLLYFQQFSGQEIPQDAGPAPEHSLQYFEKLAFPYAPGIRPRW